MSDLLAERSLLGAVLSGYPEVSDIQVIVHAQDFDHPNHERIWAAICSVIDHGRVPDAITVRSALGLEASHLPGGATYLIELAQACVSVASAPYYAAEVRAESQRRRLGAAATALHQLAVSNLPLDQLGDQARRVVDEATEERAAHKLVRIGDVLPEVVQIADHGQTRGVPTGFSDIDRLITGLTPGRVVIVGARPGVGKALSLDTPLPTPTGWTTMGEVSIGQQLIGADGHPCLVTNATAVMSGHPCYMMTFDDDTTVIADANHQWMTTTRASRRSGGNSAIRTTQEIADTIRVGSDNRTNHAVELAQPIELPEVDLPIDPYVFGVWLGDGTSNGAQVTTPDLEVVSEIRKAGYPCRKLLAKFLWSLSPGYVAEKGEFLESLRELGVWKNKHIPSAYLRASRDQRFALLQGLMDSDGTVGTAHRCSFDVTSEPLAIGFADLIASLGIKFTYKKKIVKGSRMSRSVCYRIGFTTTDPVFRLSRKAARLPDSTRSTTQQRMVVNVEPIESVPVRCVEVDSADHMYLATLSMIPTHNSLFGTNVALNIAVRDNLPTFISSMEMSRQEVTQRILAAHARISLTGLEHGNTSSAGWDAIARASDVVMNMPIIIEDNPAQSLASLRAGVRRTIKQVGSLPLVVVDYLQLMRPADSRVNRNEQIGEITRGLKIMAREFDTCIMAMAQLNRESAGSRPTLVNLRESGSIEADADVVILLHRGETSSHELEVLVEKNRSGPRGSTALQMTGAHARLSSTSWRPANVADQEEVMQ